MFRKSTSSEIHKGAFGSCCKDLADCIKQPNALIRIETNETLFLTIGYAQTEEGTYWLDHAVIYCPFCGAKLQDRKILAEKAKGK